MILMTNIQSEREREREEAVGKTVNKIYFDSFCQCLKIAINAYVHWCPMVKVLNRVCNNEKVRNNMLRVLSVLSFRPTMYIQFEFTLAI